MTHMFSPAPVAGALLAALLLGPVAFAQTGAPEAKPFVPAKPAQLRQLKSLYPVTDPPGWSQLSPEAQAVHVCVGKVAFSSLSSLLRDKPSPTKAEVHVRITRASSVERCAPSSDEVVQIKPQWVIDQAAVHAQNYRPPPAP